MTKEEIRKRFDAAIQELDVAAMQEIGFTVEISEEVRIEAVERCMQEDIDIEELIQVMREHFWRTIASAKQQGIRRPYH